MPAVRIENEAFSDRRYDVLANLLGLPDADCARGKMAAVWRQCTQQQTHVLNLEMVRAILGENGAEALVKSCLGEQADDGIRIKGTSGRVEWLARVRKNGRKGGRPKKPKTNLEVLQTEPEPNQNLTRIEPESNPLTLTPTLTTSEDPEPDLPTLGKSVPPPGTGTRQKPRKRQIPPDWEPDGSMGMNADERSQLERFRDHHRSRGNAFADIGLAWKNWRRNATDWARAGPSRAPPEPRNIPEL